MWVVLEADYPHLLRVSGEPAGPVRTRCGLELLPQQRTLLLRAMPVDACPVCEGLHRLDLVSQALQDLMVAPEGRPAGG